MSCLSNKNECVIQILKRSEFKNLIFRSNDILRWKIKFIFLNDLYQFGSFKNLKLSNDVSETIEKIEKIEIKY